MTERKLFFGLAKNLVDIFLFFYRQQLENFRRFRVSQSLELEKKSENVQTLAAQLKRNYGSWRKCSKV